MSSLNTFMEPALRQPAVAQAGPLRGFEMPAKGRAA
jgi:hypothetical protein